MAPKMGDRVKQVLDARGEIRLKDWSAYFSAPYDSVAWGEVQAVIDQGYATKERRPNADGVDEIWLVKATGGS